MKVTNRVNTHVHVGIGGRTTWVPSVRMTLSEGRSNKGIQHPTSMMTIKAMYEPSFRLPAFELQLRQMGMIEPMTPPAWNMVQNTENERPFMSSVG